MSNSNNNWPAAVQVRRKSAADRQTAREQRTDAEQLALILSRGAKDHNREVIRLRGQ